jgi:hypothetical protein
LSLFGHNPAVDTSAGDLDQIDPGRWRDPTTGLVLVRPPAHPLHRVFEAKYSALNPLVPGPNPAAWSRWDIADHVTLYGADTDTAALVESLAPVKPARLDLAAIFPDLPAGADPVGEEWEALGHMPRGQIARSWRAARRITTFSLRPGATRWFVDIAHAETIAALRRAAPSWAPTVKLRQDPLRVDLSLLTGADRVATTAAAAWTRTQILADGSEPSGIRFTSKHGGGLICWAAWIPLHGQTDQARVKALVNKTATAEPEAEILEGATALLRASRLLGIRVH